MISFISFGFKVQHLQLRLGAKGSRACDIFFDCKNSGVDMLPLSSFPNIIGCSGINYAFLGLGVAAPSSPFLVSGLPNLLG